MTLTFKGPSVLTSIGFGLNEIASAMTIANYTGAFFSRKDTARIFDPLAQGYGLQLRVIPPWLRGVHLDRNGTVLGANGFKASWENKMPDLVIDSIEGMASFLVLITRYVEGVEAVVNYIQHLLSGDYYIISGGVLENPANPQARLPFSLRDHLRKFVNSVVDADADSAQRQQCVESLRQLIDKVDGSRFLKMVTEHARSDNQKLLRKMFGQPAKTSRLPKDHFHTFSAGSATIALAAQANGANIQVICMTEQGAVEIGQQRLTPRPKDSFTVTLWLTEPPLDIIQDLGLLSRSESNKDLSVTVVPAYGGMAQISALVARQLECDLEPADSLEIWRRAIASGTCVEWCINPDSSRRLTFKLNDDSLAGNIASQAGQLARRQVHGSVRDGKLLLARKVASLLHDFFQYTDYEDAKFNTIVEFVTIAYSVGCIQKLISNDPPMLSSYAWTIDCSTSGPNPALRMQNDVKMFAKQMVDRGVSLQSILWLAACIWGGGNIPSNITDVAQHGIRNGIMSLYTGSPVTVPRDVTSGLVLAGEPMVDYARRKLRNDERLNITETDSKLLFTIEPFNHMHGGLSAIICAWESGDVALRLNPATVLHNLLAKRTLQGWQAWSNDSSNELFPIHRSKLLHLRDFHIDGGIGVVRAQQRFDWQVAAAGCVYKNEAIMLVQVEEVEEVRRAKNEMHPQIGPKNKMIILCGGDIDFPQQ